jgi:hypothetical protein
LQIYNLLKDLPATQREILIFCARRFGKSHLGVLLAFEECLQNPNVQVAIIGPSHKQTKSIVRPIIAKITNDAPKGLVTQSRTESRWNFSNGSTLLLGGFDTILESMRGMEIHAIYLEETGMATADMDEYTYLLYSVLFPTLMLSQGKLYHLTTPSRIVDHPLHLETLPKCKLANAFYKYTVEENPLLSPEDTEKEIELLGGRDSIAVQRELFCEIKRDDSVTVVPTFNESIHVADVEISHQVMYAVGGDLGYVNDLSAFCLAGYDHNIGKVVVIDELVFPATTPSSVMVAKIQEVWGSYNATYIVDIQGNTRIDMSGLGLSTCAPIKDKFDSTITYIRNQFYNDKLVINPKCKQLIETLRSATFNRNKTDFQRTSTLGHADSLMSLVYLLRSIDTTTDLRPKKLTADTWLQESRQPHQQQSALASLSWQGSKDRW